MRKRATKAEVMLRQEILRKHKLGRASRRRRAQVVTPVQANPLLGKTLAMLLLERAHGQSIEALLSQNLTQKELAKMLGIKQPTISVWKQRLGMA